MNNMNLRVFELNDFNHKEGDVMDCTVNICTKMSHKKDVQKHYSEGPHMNIKLKSSTTSAHLKAKVEIAALLVRASFLEKKHALEEQKEQIRRKRELLGVEMQIAAADAKLVILKLTKHKMCVLKQTPKKEVSLSKATSQQQLSYLVDEELSKHAPLDPFNPQLSCLELSTATVSGCDQIETGAHEKFYPTETSSTIPTSDSELSPGHQQYLQTPHTETNGETSDVIVSSQGSGLNAVVTCEHKGQGKTGFPSSLVTV